MVTKSRCRMITCTNSVGSEVNVHGDRYIYRNGVKYELIRQKVNLQTRWQKVKQSTYIYRKVEDGSTPSNGNGSQSGSSTSKAEATSNGSKGSKVLVLVQLLMEHQMVKVQIRRNLETKDGKKADGSDKATRRRWTIASNRRVRRLADNGCCCHRTHVSVLRLWIVMKRKPRLRFPHLISHKFQNKISLECDCSGDFVFR